MAVHIRRRTLPSGARRYDVAYRRGGRGYKLEHGGTFHTIREAQLRRDLIADWIAAGKNPRRELDMLVNPVEGLRFDTVSARWLASRVDLEPSTRDVYRGLLVRLDDRFGSTAVDRIAVDDVSRFVGELLADGLAAGTVNNYVRVLRMVLDVRRDNPARDAAVRLPKRPRRVVEPPDAPQVVALLEALSEAYRPVVVLMEQTGMRVSEALGVRSDDVDRGGLRVRVRPEESKGSRPRWVPLKPWYAEVVGPVRKVDRTAVGAAMRRAGQVNPHALRHRRATLWHQQGVPPAQAAAWLGHTAHEHLRTYAHVRPLSEVDHSRLLEMLG